MCIRDSDWEQLLKVKYKYLQGVVEKTPDKGFVINTDVDSLPLFSQEYQRRSFLRRISPRSLETYRSREGRKEDDSRLNEQKHSSIADLYKFSQGVARVFSDSLIEEEMAVLKSIKFREIDQLYIDEQLGLYTGITLGNVNNSTNAVGVFNYIFERLRLSQTPREVVAKIIKPALIYNLNKLANPDLDLQKKGLIMSKMAQGLGDCNTPFIDMCVMETLTMPPDLRKVSIHEMRQILEDKALQSHFKKMVSKEVRRIKEDKELPKSVKEKKLSELEFTSDLIENTVGAVLIMRGQEYRQIVVNNLVDENDTYRSLPSIIKGMPPSNFRGTNNVDFAIQQVKIGQMELIAASVCKTDDQGVPIIHEKTTEAGVVQYYEIDLDKVERITNKETQALELTASIKPEILGDEIADYIAKVCSIDENIADAVIYEGNDSPLFIPNIQKEIFMKQLRKDLKDYKVNDHNIKQYVKEYKVKLGERLFEASKEIASKQVSEQTTEQKHTTTDDISMFMHSRIQRKSSVATPLDSSTQKRRIQRSLSL